MMAMVSRSAALVASSLMLIETPSPGLDPPLPLLASSVLLLGIRPASPLESPNTSSLFHSDVSITLFLHPPPPLPSPLSFSMGTTDVRVTPLAVPELSKRSESFLISPLNYAYGYQFGCLIMFFAFK